MKRVLLAILLVCAFTVGSSAAVVDNAPLPTQAVEASTAEAIDAALVSPPVEDPADGGMTCHYVAKRNSRTKSCRTCPRKGVVFDSGIPCTPDTDAACPRRFTGSIPCPKKDEKGHCSRVKGKNPVCKNSE